MIKNPHFNKHHKTKTLLVPHTSNQNGA